MTQDRVMLLIDADNVSVGVMDQAIAHLLRAHGAVHVRRAYGTAESAVKHQAEFKRLGIKPMVNLAAGKNSTDIALAVDALDLVLAERPDVVAIASSDSDFAPLVSRLREKGCRVVGFGQEGKTGDETIQVYDDFTVLGHRSPAVTQPAPKTSAPRTPAAKTPAKRAAPAKKTAAAKKAAPAKKAPGKTAAKTAAKTADKTKSNTTATAAQKEAGKAAAAPAPPSARHGAQGLIDALPELKRGEAVALNSVAQHLREAGLLSKNGSSVKLFGQFPQVFDLLPLGQAQPNQVRLRDDA